MSGPTWSGQVLHGLPDGFYAGPNTGCFSRW